MISTTLCFLLASSMAGADAPVSPPAEIQTRWQALFGEKKLDDAEHYCSPFLSDERPPVVVEAHKCLANVILARASIVSVSTAGIGPAYTKEGALAAVRHLDEALKLAPSD